MDRVIVIEPDVEYTMDVADKIINCEARYGQKFDIFSGKSVHFGRDAIYDSWATRKTPDQPWWLDSDGETQGLEKLWSTYHCFCNYSAEVIRKGGLFGGFNERKNVSDCDTVVICENFHKLGHHEIFWDTRLQVHHHTEA